MGADPHAPNRQTNLPEAIRKRPRANTIVFFACSSAHRSTNKINTTYVSYCRLQSGSKLRACWMGNITLTKPWQCSNVCSTLWAVFDNGCSSCGLFWGRGLVRTFSARGQTLERNAVGVEWRCARHRNRRHTHKGTAHKVVWHACHPPGHTCKNKPCALRLSIQCRGCLCRHPPSA